MRMLANTKEIMSEGSEQIFIIAKREMIAEFAIICKDAVALFKEIFLKKVK